MHEYIFITVLLVLSITIPIVLGGNNTSTKTTLAYANITKNVAIGLSTNLNNDGVNFGSIDSGSSNNNAEHNSDGTESNSTYWLTISNTTNTYIDICTKDTTFSSGAEAIPNVNFTWNSTTVLGSNAPSLDGYAYQTSYDTTNLLADNSNNGTIYLRFWLDVPVGQTSGSYTNIIYWLGQENSSVCGS